MNKAVGQVVSNEFLRKTRFAVDAEKHDSWFGCGKLSKGLAGLVIEQVEKSRTSSRLEDES